MLQPCGAGQQSGGCNGLFARPNAQTPAPFSPLCGQGFSVPQPSSSRPRNTTRSTAISIAFYVPCDISSFQVRCSSALPTATPLTNYHIGRKQYFVKYQCIRLSNTSN